MFMSSVLTERADTLSHSLCWRTPLSTCARGLVVLPKKAASSHGGRNESLHMVADLVALRATQSAAESFLQQALDQ